VKDIPAHARALLMMRSNMQLELVVEENL